MTGKEIRAAVAYWQPLLGLGDWQIRVRIGRIAGGHRATAEADWHYREADLAFDPRQMVKMKDDVDEVVLHELTHLICWRGHEEAQKRARNGIDEQKLCELEENEVTIISRVFLRLHRRQK